MEKSGCRLEYSHLIFTGARSWKLLDKMLNTFYREKDKGYPIAFDNYAFHYGASVITVVFPEWYAQLSKEEAKKPLNRFKLELTILMYRKVLGIDWDDMVIAYISDEYPEYEGKTVPEAAAEEGLSNLDMYLKLVEQMYFRPEQMAERERQLLELPRLFPEIAATSSLKNNIEINSIKAGKGRALLELCAQLGIAPEDTVAFGDGLNDADMLEAAGYGAAMENAADAVKQKAESAWKQARSR